MKHIFYLSIIVLLGISCKKDPKPVITSDFDRGILCMNEGLFQQNNASLSFYQLDSQKVNQQIFSAINGRGLGDTANDMISYDYNGKPYYAIAVDVSSQIEIIDAYTLKSVKQIALFENSAPKSPRALKFYNGFLYSINFDGSVSVIDLSTHSIIKHIEVGLNPESAIIVSDQLFCINSGGLNYPEYDNTITVIDLISNTVTSTFETAINCSEVIKDEDNEIYLLSRGNYGDITPKLLKIDPSSQAVVEIIDSDINGIGYDNHTLYYYDATKTAILRYNTSTETNDESTFIDCSSFENFYGIYIDPVSKLIYLVDANGYVNSSTVKCYNIDGQFKYEFTSGLNTGKLTFTNL